MMSEGCTRSHPHELMDCCCEHKTTSARLQAQLATVQARHAWHYPAHNLDLPNLPAPGEIVVVYYRNGEDICGPTIMTPVKEDGPPTVAGLSIYQPIVRWCAIPQE